MPTRDVVSSRGRERRLKVGDMVTGYDGRTFKVIEIELFEESRWGGWEPRVRMQLQEREGIVVTLAGKDFSDAFSKGVNSGTRWILGRNVD